MKCLFLTLTLSAAALQAGVIFQNTANDTGFVDTFFDNNLTEAGDRILFSGTERQVTHVQLLLANVAANAGSSDVTLRFYGVLAGNAPGAAIGSPVTLNGVNFGANSSRTVDFVLDRTLPDEVIWTVSFANFGSLVLGINVFSPPTAGSSSPDNYWWNTGSGLAEVSSGFGSDDYYLLVKTASGALPAEPGSVTLLAAGLGALLLRRRSRPF